MIYDDVSFSKEISVVRPLALEKNKQLTSPTVSDRLMK